MSLSSIFPILPEILLLILGMEVLDSPVLITHLAANAPGFARRLKEAGISPESIHTSRDLNALPVIRKDNLVALQGADPPFGGFLARAPGELKRIFQSPGPIYDPEPRTSDYWRWKPALLAAGFEAGDVVLNCFGYHLTPAGAMFEEGLWAVGCAVIPGGTGNEQADAARAEGQRVCRPAFLFKSADRKGGGAPA
jgi:phenylacetate-coenzyme A ligase PaaK-like adenylate-forming protein